jgi:hypothetical protein
VPSFCGHDGLIQSGGNRTAQAKAYPQQTTPNVLMPNKGKSENDRFLYGKRHNNFVLGRAKQRTLYVGKWDTIFLLPGIETLFQGSIETVIPLSGPQAPFKPHR